MSRSGAPGPRATIASKVANRSRGSEPTKKTLLIYHHLAFAPGAEYDTRSALGIVIRVAQDSALEGSETSFQQSYLGTEQSVSALQSSRGALKILVVARCQCS